MIKVQRITPNTLDRYIDDPPPSGNYMIDSEDYEPFLHGLSLQRRTNTFWVVIRADKEYKAYSEMIRFRREGVMNFILATPAAVQAFIELPVYLREGLTGVSEDGVTYEGPTPGDTDGLDTGGTETV